MVETPDPMERRRQLQTMPLENGTPFPSTVTYEDIDAAFKQWCEEKIEISFEGKRLPTMTLLSGQRFSEYAQTWSYSDDNKNILLNFKTITRENNPQKGTIHGTYYNIPGNRKYPMFYVYTEEENGRMAVDAYSMAQPMAIDLRYELSVFTNKYDLLNIFNTIVNDRFKAIQDYVNVNGHYMPMKLENMSDSSEYSIDDRKYFSQTATILLMGYLVKEEDFEITHYPGRSIFVMDGSNAKGKPVAKVEEDELKPNGEDDSRYYYRPATINMEFPVFRDVIKFTMDRDITITQVDFDNVRSFRLYINDNSIVTDSVFTIHDGDRVRVKIFTYNFGKEAKLSFIGHYPDEVYDSEDDFPEAPSDEKHSVDEINIV